MRKTVPPFSAETYADRRKSLLRPLPDNSVLVLYSGECFVRSFDSLFRFCVDADFCYLIGIDEEDCRYTAVKRNGTLTETLYVPPVSKEKEQWDGIMLTPWRATEISGVQTVVFNSSFEKYFYRDLRYAETLYCSLNNVHPNQPLSYWHRYLNELGTRFPGTAVKKITPRLNEMRLQKDAHELERMQRATDIVGEAMLQALRMIKPELYEYRIEALISSVYHHQGCRNGFDAIVGSGKNGATLHYADNNGMMKDGDLVLIDTGVSYGGYNADITRTFPVNGVFTGRQRIVYETNLTIQEQCIAEIKAGMTSLEVLKRASEIQGAVLQSNGFVDDEKKHGHITVHRIGHPIGIDVHDPVDTSLPLPVGTVMTVEPGIYLPEENIGVRIEDMVVLTETGCNVLSKNIPKHPDDIEQRMKIRH